MEAFWELSSTRAFGMVVGPIPWHRMVQYAEHRGLEDEMVDLFVRVMRELDEAYLKWQTGRQKKQLGAEQSADDVKARRGRLPNRRSR
jgi:hypothetical protein